MHILAEGCVEDDGLEVIIVACLRHDMLESLLNGEARAAQLERAVDPFLPSENHEAVIVGQSRRPSLNMY